MEGGRGGPAQWELVPSLGQGSRQTGRIAARGGNFLKPEMWMEHVTRGSPSGVGRHSANGRGSRGPWAGSDLL